MGKTDIRKHSQTKSHVDIAKTKVNQSTLDTLTRASSQLSMQCIESEVKMAVLVACSNVPIAFNDRLSPAIRTIFRDSKVASMYHSARTKATSILNIAVAPHLISVLVKRMKCHAFSLAIDGTNDCELQKMNPITVRIYDNSVSKVVTHFLDMCTTTTL